MLLRAARACVICARGAVLRHMPRVAAVFAAAMLQRYMLCSVCAVVQCGASMDGKVMARLHTAGMGGQEEAVPPVHLGDHAQEWQAERKSVWNFRREVGEN